MSPMDMRWVCCSVCPLKFKYVKKKDCICEFEFATALWFFSPDEGPFLNTLDHELRHRTCLDHSRTTTEPATLSVSEGSSGGVRLFPVNFVEVRRGSAAGRNIDRAGQAWRPMRWLRVGTTLGGASVPGTTRRAYSLWYSARGAKLPGIFWHCVI